MFDRSLLEDIGFQRGKGWDHEVWVYEGEFWIHYGNYDHERWPSSTAHVDGNTVTRKQLFTAFLSAIKESWYESNVELTEDW